MVNGCSVGYTGLLDEFSTTFLTGAKDVLWIGVAPKRYKLDT